MEKQRRPKEEEVHEDDDGSITWRKNGLLHRENDLPAVIRPDGTRMWYRRGMRHRTHNDLPAVILPDGSQLWFREDKSYCQHWCKNGKRHRDDDRPAVVWENMAHEWYQNGERHRDGDRPAVIRVDGTQEWWKHGKLHRENNNLPAVVYADRTKNEWWQNGKRCSVPKEKEEELMEEPKDMTATTV